MESWLSGQNKHSKPHIQLYYMLIDWVIRSVINMLILLFLGKVSLKKLTIMIINIILMITEKKKISSPVKIRCKESYN